MSLKVFQVTIVNPDINPGMNERDRDFARAINALGSFGSTGDCRNGLGKFIIAPDMPSAVEASKKMTVGGRITSIFEAGDVVGMKLDSE